MLLAFRQIRFLEWYLNLHNNLPMPYPIRFDILKSTMLKIIHRRDPHSVQYFTPPTLFSTIMTYNNSTCKNVLDKAYGFLGVVLPCCTKSLGVDYSLKAQNLCHGVTQHYLAAHGKGSLYQLQYEVEKLLGVFGCYVGDYPQDRLGAVVRFAPGTATIGPFPCVFMGIVLKDPIRSRKVRPSISGALHEIHI